MSQPPPYGYPPEYYGSGYGAGYPPPPRGTNGLAIASLVCAILFAPLGIVFGHLSLAQIKKTGEEGRGLAVAGLVIGYLITALTVVVVVVSVLFFLFLASALEDVDLYPDSPRYTVAPPAELPAFQPPATLGSNCQYPATIERAAKPVKPPSVGAVATDPARVDATIGTSQGDIGVRLDNAKAPCTVHNFTSLARQGFFDDTTCHRLITTAKLHALQCGDPTGEGTGGPGYQFPNEYPTNQYRLNDPALRLPVRYPRGTLAMANTGLGTNGSQFLLIYADSPMPPTYTAFGTVDAAGLAVLDKIGAEGVVDGGDDGTPAVDVTITSVRLD
ncbi:peptidylprolyl isomerase [Mycolicibacterium pulveris]|uniref:peptidylprolyl isomerase n=1 Tax=Mycolicibacterium pulveris TaxID=36813 RepID=UPI003CE7B86D